MKKVSEKTLHSIDLKKQNKKAKNKKNKIIKWTILLFLFEIIMVYAFILCYCANSPITEENSFVVSGKPEDIEINDGLHVTHLFFSLDSTRLRIGGEFSGGDPDVWSNQFKAERNVTATVIKKRFISGETNFVVDLRSDTNVYANVNDYNKKVSLNRFLGCTVIIVIWIVVNLFWVIMGISYIRDGE